MLKSVSIVLALSVIGDTFVYAFQIPIPGAALGLLLLTGLFVLRGGPDPDTATLFDTIAPVFPMFFVPAAAGIIDNAGILSAAWFYSAIAIVFGTAMTIIVTGHVAQALLGASTEARTQ